MISSIRRSATTLLAISTRRNLILSSSTFASLALTAVSPFTSSAIAAPSRYNSNNNQCTDTSLTMSSIDTGYLNAQDAADLDAELMSTPGFSLGKLSTYAFPCCITYLHRLTRERCICMQLSIHRTTNGVGRAVCGRGCIRCSQGY